MTLMILKDKVFALMFWIAITLEIIALWYLIHDMYLRGRSAVQKLIRGNTRRFA